MQTNIAEIDPTRYDIPWWREQWRRTETQGVVVNAGGIVAYYPTTVPFHRRAEYLGDRDLFGELRAAAHADGIVVFARMDSNGAPADVRAAHPEWFTQNAAGEPYRRETDLFVPCVNGGYYREHIPAILREIAGGYHPEGFTDNSWSGLGRGSICYCANCRDKFQRERGLDLPRSRDWSSPAYRAWIEWSYQCRLEIWDLFNGVAREAGGADCLWVGMIGGTISASAAEFRDARAICSRAKMIMLDNQHRSAATGFQANAETGLLIHGLLGWDKLAPESMALYETSGATFRLAMRPEAELRLWAVEGFAAGVQPWWHYVNAYHEDRRMYDTPVALSAWHAKHEALLAARDPVATVGIVYSQRNNDFFGRDDVALAVDAPQRGFLQALLRARIPYVFVNADDLDRDARGLRALVLPNIGALSDAQLAAIRAFAGRGGGLLATGMTGGFDESGDPRQGLPLGDLLGVRVPREHPLWDEATRRRWASERVQTYLRLLPERRGLVFGPHVPGEPTAAGPRHPALAGFDKTDILAYGGTLAPVIVDPSAQVLMTWVPPRPVFPPEAVWLRDDKTDIPGLVVRDLPGGGRAAYLLADLDRRYARDNVADWGDLVAHLVRWVAKDDIPLAIDGPGLLDCHLFRQATRTILHVVNLSNEGAWRAPVDEIVPVGPLQVAVGMPVGRRARAAHLLVAGRDVRVENAGGRARFTIDQVRDHEVIVIES